MFVASIIPIKDSEYTINIMSSALTGGLNPMPELRLLLITFTFRLHAFALTRSVLDSREEH